MLVTSRSGKNKRCNFYSLMEGNRNSMSRPAVVLHQFDRFAVQYQALQTITGSDIGIAAKLLREGRLVAIPTETVYGLAADAMNEDAVLDIFRVKNRPFFDPLIVHTHSVAEAHRYSSSVSPGLARLMERFMPGPFTVLLPKKEEIPDLVTSGLVRAAFRVPAHPAAMELLQQLSFPLAAPSANPFGYISPTTAAHVYDQLKGLIPYILDGGACRIGIESTIAGEESGQIIIYRLGGLSIEEIEEVAGPVHFAGKEKGTPSPGMLASHYAPRKPLFLGDLESLLKTHGGQRTAVLSFSKKYADGFILSETGSLDEAAKRLFTGLRLLDGTNADVILAEMVPDTGLGRAINDRLRRAAAGY